MKSDLQISQLKTLIAIDEEGGFSAAAIRVKRTQSAVTQQMKSLEDVVGTPLFVAKGRQRELTEAGQILLRHGHEIISMCNQAVSASSRSKNTGLIKIGAPLEIAEELLPRVLRYFGEKWSGVRVIVHISRSPTLMNMLESGQIELALSTRNSKNYDSVSLCNMPVHWIAASNWQYDPTDPLPLILTDEPSMFRRIALAALDLSGQPYIERLTSSSLSGVRLAVAAELGITARTKSTFFADTKILDDQYDLPPLPDIPYYLHRSHLNISQEMTDLVETIRDCST